ncbi:MULTISPECIES: NIF family HAD-type phosphatase [Methylophaga]|jgi:hypothetical protein|uniref:NIF family HAD-type phosphatase n=1 Tax=Methylophaga TaxID=40222 RepID=UPI000C6C0619|nr:MULTISPECIES: NIF family HAD-type phosphatase [Methylophaga]MAX50604.1 hypothetical protein [Methylophaga sp.]WVI84017.1 NIF family HAD-type phosphatase [Methylophaga thalassica]|tara:strand:- start:810 stop:1265 length:456 start_codon:yes stop_codon:yes gene_type:complete
MTHITLALDLEGVLITNAISQFPRPGLKSFLEQCEALFDRSNMCIFTAVNEMRFRTIAERLVADGYAPVWFATIRYIDWVGEHKDLRFVREDIDKVIIVDDYPPYIKQTQKHRLIEIKQYMEPYTHAMPDMQDNELDVVLHRLKEFLSNMD